jgi:hypothetical protein
VATDDCFVKFDQAFAKLEADLNTPGADLREFEEAFSQIDRHLDARPASPVEPAPEAAAPLIPTPATTRSLIAESTVAMPATAIPDDAPAVATAPVAGATPTVEAPTVMLAASRGSASALVPYEVDELWRKPSGGGTPLERLVVMLQNLLWLESALQARAARGLDRFRSTQLAEVFSDARQVCADFDLPTARVRAEFALAALDAERLDLLAAEIAQLLRHVRHDLQSCSIWPIARGRVWTFTATLDERTSKSFPSAVPDIAEGGRAAGFGLHHAAVFHMLRAAECGRRALASAARLQPSESDAPDWASTCALLHTRLADLTNWPAGPARKAAKTFFSAALDDARVLQEAHLRLTSGGAFDEVHVILVVNTTRTFLARVAGSVSELADAQLTRQHFGA